MPRGQYGGWTEPYFPWTRLGLGTKGGWADRHFLGPACSSLTPGCCLPLGIFRNGSSQLGGTTPFHVLPEAGSVLSVNPNSRTPTKDPSVSRLVLTQPKRLWRAQLRFVSALDLGWAEGKAQRGRQGWPGSLSACPGPRPPGPLGARGWEVATLLACRHGRSQLGLLCGCPASLRGSEVQQD